MRNDGKGEFTRNFHLHHSDFMVLVLDYVSATQAIGKRGGIPEGMTGLGFSCRTLGISWPGIKE